MQFLLDGSVRVTADDDAPHELGAPAVLAFKNMLEGSPLRLTIRAVDRTVCLALRGDEFLTMLSDNIVMAQGLFRMLLDTPKARHWRTVYAPKLDSERVNERSLPLQPLEKVLMLRENPLLERATVPQLLELATVTREVSFAHGSVLFNETDPPALYYVIEGDIRLEGDAGGAIVARPGSTIGISETLAGVSLGLRAVVTRDGHALRIDHDDLFDVLGDHIDLLQGVFSALLQVQKPESVLDRVPQL